MEGRAGCAAFVLGAGLFAGGGVALAAVEDHADDVEDQREEDGCGEAQDHAAVAVQEMPVGVDDGGAEPDEKQRPTEELNEFAEEGCQNEGQGLHLKDTGGELDDFERRGRRAHGRDQDGEKLLTLEAVAQLLVTLAIDALHQEELSTGTANEEGDQRAERGSGGTHQAVNDEEAVVGLDVYGENAVEAAGDGNQRGVDEGEAGDAPDAEGNEEGQQECGELMQKNDGMQFHGIFILSFASMCCVACEEIEGVGQERKDGSQGTFSSFRAAGEIDNKAVRGDTGYAAAEGGEGSAGGAVLADEFGEAGDEAGADGECGFGGDVAGGEAGAASGEDQRSAGGCGVQRGDELRGLVGEGERVDDLGASLGEEMGEGGAGEVGLCAGEAAVADGEDDGGAAGERLGGRHRSRITAGGRNRSKDEKIDRPASFWSGDWSRCATLAAAGPSQTKRPDAANTPTDRSRVPARRT